MPQVIERQVRSYMEDPSNTNQPNIIHSTAGAQAYGFSGALVTGSIVYGWCTPAILEALGPEWLQQGWADIRFRRPVYPDDLLTVRVEPIEDGASSLEVIRHGDAGDEVALTGTLGAGIRDVIGDFTESPRVPAVPQPDPPPVLRLDEAPVGAQLATLATSLPWPAVPPAEASTEQRLAGVLLDDVAYANPAGVSGRMSWYGHAVYDYAGPSIHTRTQVQYLRPTLVDERIEVAAVVKDAYERKGHHYIVYDGTMRSGEGDLLARVRHTTIFRVAPPGE